MTRILFLSDIHGSPCNLREVLAYVMQKPVEQIVLLGDELYHGPRNPLKDDYEPKAVVEILNGLKEKLIAVRGNCDCEVDQMLFEFPIMSDYSTLLVDGYKFFLSHGHKWNSCNLPPVGSCSVLCYGHTHIPDLHISKDDNRVICFNPGSVSLPKGQFPASYGIYEDGVLGIYEVGTNEAIVTKVLSEALPK